MKSCFLLALTVLFVIAVGYIANMKRYQLAAKLWHWRHGYSVTVGNYEVPVPEHWLFTHQDEVGFPARGGEGGSPKVNAGQGIHGPHSTVGRRAFVMS